MAADGLPGGLDQCGRPVYAFNGITSAREFASISARSTAGIKKCCAWKDAPFTEPGGDRGALVTDRTVDQEIERPRILTVKRATGLLGHGSRKTVEQRCRQTTLREVYVPELLPARSGDELERRRGAGSLEHNRRSSAGGDQVTEGDRAPSVKGKRSAGDIEVDSAG